MAWARERDEYKLPGCTEADHRLRTSRRDHTRGGEMKSRMTMFALLLALVAPSLGSAQQKEPHIATPSRYDDGYLVFRSADSAFSYMLDGRLQVDAAMYRGGENKLGSGTDVRRARIGAKATLFRDWHG